MAKEVYIPPLEGRKLMLSFRYNLYSQGRGGLDAKIGYGGTEDILPVVDVDGEPDDDVRYTDWVSFSKDISSVASQTSSTALEFRFSTFDSEDEHTYLELDDFVLALDPPGGGCIPSSSGCNSGLTISTLPTTPEGTYTINVAALSELYGTSKSEPIALTVKNRCGNGICDYPVEDQSNCPVDCLTTVTVNPRSLPAGQPISITVEFEDSRYKAGKDVQLDIQLENIATGAKFPWNSGNGCSVGWTRRTVSQWGAISQDGKFSTTFTCTVPSTIGAGDKRVHVTPKIYP
jgi:hypothetical protein